MSNDMVGEDKMASLKRLLKLVNSWQNKEKNEKREKAEATLDQHQK